MKKPVLKISFSDFWPGFNKHNNFFTQLLSEEYILQVVEHSPDILVYSSFGTEFLDYRCIRFFYTGEQITPNFKLCDYALSFQRAHQRNFRLPLYLMYGYYELTNVKPHFSDFLQEKRKFCNFVYSNRHCKKRNNFFHKLSKYKVVDSGGKLWNNIGRPVDDKCKFLQNYKFSIAFENECYPGYTTEKIVEPMTANSLPIYWGNPFIDKEFNSRSFLNYFDFQNENELIEKIIFLDQNDSAYEKYYTEPYLSQNKIPDSLAKKNILLFFKNSLSTGPIIKKPEGILKSINRMEHGFNNKLMRARSRIRGIV